MSSVQMVNGYPCNNCTDVDNAKKHIDPKHPKSGPYGVNAKDDPTSPDYNLDTAVTFGGALAGLTQNQIAAPQNANSAAGGGSGAQQQTRQPWSQRTGQVLNLTA